MEKFYSKFNVLSFGFLINKKSTLLFLFTIILYGNTYAQSCAVNGGQLNQEICVNQSLVLDGSGSLILQLLMQVVI